jgi:hypothetical protein
VGVSAPLGSPQRAFDDRIALVRLLSRADHVVNPMYNTPTTSHRAISSPSWPWPSLPEPQKQFDHRNPTGRSGARSNLDV